jgi:hypothetical protein
MQTIVRRHPSLLFLVLLTGMLPAGCSPTATLTPGVALIHPADGMFLPLAPYTMDAESIGVGFSHINFIVNGVTVDSEPVDTAAAGAFAHYTWTPPATGEYYLDVDGIGGPGGANRYVDRHLTHVCVTRSVTRATPGYTGTGCDPMLPTLGFTSLHGWPDPVYYDAPAGSTACPGDITIAAELNDIAHIADVNIHFDFYAGSSTTPFGGWQGELPFKAERTYADDYVLASFTDVDFSALHGGDGSVSFYAFAFDIGSARVALTRPIALRLRHCVAGTPTLSPTLLPTLGLTSTSTSTSTLTRTARPTVRPPTKTPLPPPPLTCSDFNKVPDKCKLSGCYYWSDGTCSSSPQPTVPPPCISYGDQKSCEAAGSCKWDGKSCN